MAGLQAVLAPLLATVEARLTLAASMAIRRAVLAIAATLFGVGALMFLSLGVFFGLMPGLGAAGAALILALIWALLAGLCYVLTLVRPRRVAAPVAAPVAARLPPVAAPPPVDPAAPVGVPPAPRAGRAAAISRAAPLLAIAALAAGIVAGRR
jgi:hypothetical protein